MIIKQTINTTDVPQSYLWTQERVAADITTANGDPNNPGIVSLYWLQCKTQLYCKRIQLPPTLNYIDSIIDGERKKYFSFSRITE
jgi:hypothetical protein